MDNALTRLWKRLFNAKPWLGATVIPLDSMGWRGTKRPDFDYTAAVRRFTGWCYAAAGLNANAAGSAQLRLYVKDRGEAAHKHYPTRKVGKRQLAYMKGDAKHRPSGSVLRKAADDTEYVEVMGDHPLLDLMNKVNPWMTGRESTTLRHLWLQLTGNCYWQVITGGGLGVPTELWPMPPQWTWIQPGKPDSGVFIKSYLYGPDPNRMREFEPEDVIHFKYPNPRNVYYGLGKVEAGWDILYQDAAIHEHDSALYANHARPDYMAIVKNGAAPEAMTRFEQRLQEEFRGNHKAGRVLVAGGDIDIKPLQWPPKDMAGREDVVEEIAAVFGVPVSKLKANDPNKASAGVGDDSWLSDTIQPMRRLDEDVLNEQLLPRFALPQDAYVCYDNPVEKDNEFEHRQRSENVRVGVISYNEARSEIGYEPVDGGDEPLVPAGLVPLSMVTASAEASLASTAAATEAALNPPKPVPGDKPEKRVRQSAHWKAAAATGPRDESERRIQRFRGALGVALAKQRDRVLDLFPKEKAAKATQPTYEDMLGALEDSEDEIAEILAAYMRESVKEGGDVGNGKIGVASAFDVSNPKVSAWLRAYTPRLARSLNATAARHIQDRVQAGVVAGDSIGEIAAAIERSFYFSEDGIANRAEMIARTESARAFTEGNLQAWEESGAVSGKQWLLAPDACEFCEAVAKEYEDRTLPLRQPFKQVGDAVRGESGAVMELDYSDTDAPPLHPQCRCDTVPVLVGE